MHELHYSPSQLLELYEAPRNFKAFLYGSIDFLLEERAKESKKKNT